MLSIGDKVVCIKRDVMCALSEGETYTITKVRDRRYWTEDGSMDGYIYYGVNDSSVVFREDKFEEI